MALKPRKGIFIPRLRVCDDCWRSSKLQAPSSRETPNHKLQGRLDGPLELGAWCFFGIWSWELGASFSPSVSGGQGDEDVLQRRRDGADVGLANADAVE